MKMNRDPIGSEEADLVLREEDQVNLQVGEVQTIGGGTTMGDHPIGAEALIGLMVDIWMTDEAGHHRGKNS